MKKLIQSVFLMSLLFSCKKETASNNINYYDFSGYFQNEIDRLNSDTLITLTKNVTLNKITEQKVLVNPDFNEELAIFKKISIKPINWKNGYALDSMVKVDAQLSALYYSATDPKLEIRQIIITDTMEWQNDSIIYPVLNSPYQLLFNLNNSNILTESGKKLVYQPAYGFLIKGNQKTVMLRASDFAIRAWWANK